MAFKYLDFTHDGSTILFVKIIMYKLIALDLDETLLNSDSTVSEKNKKAIQAAKDKGVKIALATGRGYETVQGTLEEIGLKDKPGEYVISFNGGVIVENKDNKILEKTPLDREIAEKLFQKGLELGDCIHIYTKDKVYVQNYTENEKNYLNGKMDIDEIDEDSLDFLGEEEIIKMLFVNEDYDYLKGVEKQLADLKNDIDVSYSANRYIEFNPKGIHKGMGLRKLAEILDIKPEETIAVGDNINDLPMIKEAGLGVGVANTNPDMISECDFITEADHNHDAIAEVIEKFVLTD